MVFDPLHITIEALFNAVLLLGPCQEVGVEVIIPANYEVRANVVDLGSFTGKCVKTRTSTTPTTPTETGMKSITVTFPPPREFENGDPATLNDIDHFEVEFDGDKCIYATSISVEGERTRSDCSVIDTSLQL